ncbi:hypothetical protein M409DRAFT_28995 [Zasmidium cellare ATCC 36951]|uniref:DUF7587 domain-containing protein n=1 Tax=Zasmidium cellare ATCC 36951 TaxID=1080233 RepID=A0A6A6C2U0_ZASCE|nr:uncharacterized protein M409DRAFT_28995 [Zasmidium cellare ATCC 36951]KAF2160608.1 hypothetical protein M409DRAFT_28995 [Zasmidium cellare ATCC 36951]
MAPSFEVVLDMMQTLSVAAPGPGPTTKLDDATEKLIEAAQDVIAEARKVQKAIRSAKANSTHRVSSIIALRKEASALSTNITKVRDSSEEYAMSQIISSAKPSSAEMGVGSILSRFSPQIKNFIRFGLDRSPNPDNAVWKIVEECYKHALNDGGCLCIEPVRSGNTGPKSLNFKWIAFWRRALHSCHGGPTIFWPLSMFDPYDGKVSRPPRYLFRFFDSQSFGRTDDTVVASMASIHKQAAVSRIDLLNVDKAMATQMLHSHIDLAMGSFGGHADNLMSWSSSLLFAIQGAIYRCDRTGRDPRDMKILVVDTHLFPMGQFFRDLWVFKRLKCAQSDHPRLRQLVEWRVSNVWDSGGWFSQGTLNHQGRSCTTSLQQLIDAGLYYLYPEFEESDGATLWTKRTDELRGAWSFPHPTYHEEVDFAFDIASACFGEFSYTDLALLLLCFKNRGRMTEGWFTLPLLCSWETLTMFLRNS